MRDFRGVDTDALARFWNSVHPENYHVTPAVFAANTIAHPLFDWGASCVISELGIIQGFAVTKRSASPSHYRGPDPDTAHLSGIAFLDPFIGIELLRNVKDTLRQRGISRITFGGDASHFWPGCPTEMHALRDFLTIEGFDEQNEIFDLERDLSTYENTRPVPEGFTLRPIAEADVESLRELLNAEFPGRWTYDVLAKISLEERSDFVIGLFDGDKVVGMAMTQDATHKRPVNGAVWHLSLGENWGALGPIGVAKSLRGKGCGHALLGGALEDLKRRGATKTIIDWTTLKDFYGAHGFEPTRYYREMVLVLD